jgi:sulfite oxidase
VLIGHRWKEYHAALGLSPIVDDSWNTVLREKPDILHLLDFPYNGETRAPQLMRGKITKNEHHLYVAESVPFCVLGHCMDEWTG